MAATLAAFLVPAASASAASTTTVGAGHGLATYDAPGFTGGDVNADGNTDTVDLDILSAAIGTAAGDSGWNALAAFDVAGNAGIIDLGDVTAASRRIVYSDRAFSLIEATSLDAQKAMNAGVITAVDLTEKYLARIQSYDKQGPSLNSLISVNEDALAQAAESDRVRASGGAHGLLFGIPVVVKDNYDTVGMATTAGCSCLADNVTATNATMIQNLVDDGAIILGKANMHEWAYGLSTFSSIGGQTRNPYDLSQNPGGSSGGTGASISANLAMFGLGTDTGGSIRIPSSWNSLVGIRPTVGVTSRSGIIPLAGTQDSGGPMARSVQDAALALDSLVSRSADPTDAATAPNRGRIPDSYTQSLDPEALAGARIGVITEARSTDPSVARLTEEAIAAMRAQGATVVDVSVPDYRTLIAYPSGSSTEFHADVNQYFADHVTDPRVPYRSIDEVNAAMLADPANAASISSINLQQLATVTPQQREAFLVTHAQQQQTVRDALTSAMATADLDALIYPSTSTTASGSAGNANRLSALSGFPAVSVPMGFAQASDGLSARPGTPAGIEFLAGAFAEPTLIGYAYSFEQATRDRVSPVLFPELPGETR